MCEDVPLHHPNGAAGGAVSISIREMNKAPEEPRRSVPEGLLALMKELHGVRGAHGGALLQDMKDLGRYLLRNKIE